MTLAIILLIIDLASVFSILYFTGIYTIWWADLLMALSIYFIYWVLFGLCIVYLFFYSRLMSLDKDIQKPYKQADWWTRNMCYVFVILMRVKVNIINKELMPKEDCLIVTNHISLFDPMLLLVKYMNKKIYCISKPENVRKPIGGKVIYYGGTIPIDRENPRKAIKSIIKGAEYISSGIGSIYVCPEGTRSKDFKLHDFHAGTFKIATHANAKIVVCAIRNTNRIVRNLFIRPYTKATAEIITVINPEEYQDMTTQEISDKVHSILEENLSK